MKEDTGTNRNNIYTDLLRNDSYVAVRVSDTYCCCPPYCVLYVHVSLPVRVDVIRSIRSIFSLPPMNLSGCALVEDAYFAGEEGGSS